MINSDTYFSDSLNTTPTALEQMKFQEYMSNTAIQRQVADMQKAGINPLMAANYMGASTPNGASGDVAAAIGGAAKSNEQIFGGLFGDLVQLLTGSRAKGDAAESAINTLAETELGKNIAKGFQEAGQSIQGVVAQYINSASSGKNVSTTGNTNSLPASKGASSNVKAASAVTTLGAIAATSLMLSGGVGSGKGLSKVTPIKEFKMIG